LFFDKDPAVLAVPRIYICSVAKMMKYITRKRRFYLLQEAVHPSVKVDLKELKIDRMEKRNNEL
jgi:hypothetical protein